MDATDPRIRFDADGVCSHCREYAHKVVDTAPTREEAHSILASYAERVREAGRQDEYDCVIGLSGGTDSSYLAYVVAKELELRPLAVHLDNGWDSKLAVRNIHGIVRKLNIDLHTHVIDWEEFKDLQLAYLKASVIDIEVLTDHAINAILYRVAHENGIKFVLYGTNRVTEQILPLAWKFNKNDLKNIRAIHDTFGTVPMKTFPQMGRKRLRFYERSGIERFSPLNYMQYEKSVAQRILAEELRWADYGTKHGESVFTRFYQGYILPKKFGVDKRKAHFSTLINSGQMTRGDALKELEHPPYDPSQQKDDYDYVVRKLGLEAASFERIMAQPVRSHFDFPTDIRSKLNYALYPVIYPWYQRIRNFLPQAKQRSHWTTG